MKRVLLSLVLIVLVIGLAVAGCAEQAPSPAPTPTPTPTPTPAPAPAPVKPIAISLALSGPPAHLQYQAIAKPWGEELEQRTGGRVKVTIHHSSALGGITESYALAERGVCDVTSSLPAIQMGRFPFQDVYGLPYLLPYDARDKDGNIVRDIILEKYMIPIHFNDVKIMWTNRFLPKTILCRDKPIRNADDAKGMIIAHPGGVISPAVFSSALGARPETLGVPDFYLSQERGVVDAVTLGAEALTSYKLWEVTKYVIRAGELSPGDISLWIMNAETWASLPPDIQKIIDELALEYQEIGTTAWIEYSRVAVEFSKEQGLEVITITPEVHAIWKERTKHLADWWAQKMNDKGLPGTEVVNDLTRLAAESQGRILDY